jgi:hypothetical protein
MLKIFWLKNLGWQVRDEETQLTLAAPGMLVVPTRCTLVDVGSAGHLEVHGRIVNGEIVWNASI